MQSTEREAERESQNLHLFCVSRCCFGRFARVVCPSWECCLDTGKRVTLKGTVTDWVWANPHCWLKFDVKDDKGNVAHWVAETNNAPDMMEKGWTMHSFKPGDEVSVTVEPVKNGNPVGRVIQVVLPNGQTLGMAYLRTGQDH